MQRLRCWLREGGMMWRPTRRLRTEASPRCGTTPGGQSNRERSFFKNTPMTQTALANQTGGAVASFCIFLLTTNALLQKRLRPWNGHVDQQLGRLLTFAAGGIVAGISNKKQTFTAVLRRAFGSREGIIEHPDYDGVSFAVQLRRNPCRDNFYPSESTDQRSFRSLSLSSAKHAA